MIERRRAKNMTRRLIEMYLEKCPGGTLLVVGLYKNLLIKQGRIFRDYRTETAPFAVYIDEYAGADHAT